MDTWPIIWIGIAVAVIIIVFGVLLVVIMIFLPNGVVSGIGRLATRLRKRLSPTAEEGQGEPAEAAP